MKANSERGLISRELTEAILSLDSPFVPRLGWLVKLTGSIGMSEETALTVVYGLLLCSGVCLMIRNVALTCSPVENDSELLNKDAVNVQQ